MRAGAWVALAAAVVFAAFLMAGWPGDGAADEPVRRPGQRTYTSFDADGLHPSAPSGHPPSIPGERSVIGADERIQITDTAFYPWRAIAYLALFDANGNEFSGCSGTFVGPDVLLTAAHCLWDAKTGFTWDIAVIPGRDGDYFPYGYVWGENWIVPDGWIESEGTDSNFDFGLVKLSDGTMGQTVGWFVVSHLQTDTLNLPDFSPAIAGYPGDRPEGTMWAGQKASFAAVGPNFLDYTIDTFGGQSGSAVFSADLDSPYLGHIAGVHILGGETLNSARRANMELFLGIYDQCVQIGCSLAMFLEGAGLQDGGFEEGSPSTSWAEYSANFGGVICDPERCGEADAMSGDWWVWFGGYDNKVEEAYLEQALTIPEGTNRLSFWLQIPTANGDGDDYMTVSMDGTTLFTVTDQGAADFATYQRVDINIGAWADGLVHRLRFDSVTYGGGAATSFYVDSVALGSGPISTPTATDTPDTPTATATSTSTPGPGGIQLFEGWNPVRNWPGPRLESEDPGDDGIADYLDGHQVPANWLTVARYEGGFWAQRFKESPSPSFQTLDVIQPGDDLWLMVSGRSTLNVP
jgi:V8-like Glu-specific endopeptidase